MFVVTRPTVWEWITGWWTPGWGSFFTVGVAFTAIAVSAYFSHRALQGGREQASKARRDVRNDKLRAEIAELLEAISERASRDTIFRARRSKSFDMPDGGEFGAVLKAWQREENADVEEAVSDLYRRIALHSFVILTLTTDPELSARVRTLAKLAADEIADVRKLVNESGRGRGDSFSVGAFFGDALRAGHRAQPRKEQIDRESEALREYCLEHFPRWEE